MHPFYRDLTVKDETLLWRDCDPDELVDLANSESVTFKEIAKKYNIPCTKEINSSTISHQLGGYPRYLILPDEGTIDRETLHELLPVLTTFTRELPCYFHYDFLKLIHVLPFEDDVTDNHLYYGNLEDVFSLYEKGKDKLELGSPTYWWPKDRSWCIHTDYDLDFSLFGGTKEMVNQLLSKPNLECIEVDRNTRIDPDADKEQKRKRPV